MHTAKILTSIVILLALIVGLGMYSTNILSSSSDSLKSNLDELEGYSSSDNWDKAKEKLTVIENDWSKSEKSWAMLIDHLEIDNIDTTIKRMGKFIETKDKALALGEIAILRQYIKHIPEKESFSLKNIL